MFRSALFLFSTEASIIRFWRLDRNSSPPPLHPLRPGVMESCTEDRLSPKSQHAFVKFEQLPFTPPQSQIGIKHQNSTVSSSALVWTAYVLSFSFPRLSSGNLNSHNQLLIAHKQSLPGTLENCRWSLLEPLQASILHHPTNHNHISPAPQSSAISSTNSQPLTSPPRRDPIDNHFLFALPPLPSHTFSGF